MPLSVTFSRIIKYGLLNLWRYRWLSVTAIIVMAISLLVTSSLLLLNDLSEIAASDLRSRVDISLFFANDTSEERILDIKAEYEKMEEIRSIRYISAEQALADFREKHRDEELIQRSLDELAENPLQGSLVLVAKELEDYPIIISKIENSRFQPLIDKINYKDSEALITTLQKVTAGLRSFGILLAAVFGLVAILVMFNTLRLTIFSRREEIEIMRLVGASNRYIRGPFLVEGLLYGLAGSVIAALVVYPMVLSARPGIRQFFNLELPPGSLLTDGFWRLLLIQTALGCTLGIFSSLVATRKHLKI